MKYLLKTFVFIILTAGMHAQNNDNLSKEAHGSIIMIKANNTIKGKKYIYDEWNKGVLIFNDTVLSKQDYIQYDAQNQGVLIKNKKKLNEVIKIADNNLTGFSILELKKNIKHNFVRLSSFNFEGNENGGFFEIVNNVENTNFFLKKNTKVLYDPNRSKGSQTINNFPLELRSKKSYFIKNKKGLYVPVKLRKKLILAMLPEHSKEISAFIKVKRISFNNELDVSELVNYYYSL